MKKMWTVIKKEYKQIVKKKSFLISTVITPLIMGAFIFMPLLIASLGREAKVIEILDYSGIIGAPFIQRSQENKVVSETLKLKFRKSVIGDNKQEALIQEYEQAPAQAGERDFPLLPALKEQILKKKVAGLLIIPSKVKEDRRIYFCALNISDFRTNEYIGSTVQKILSEKLLTEQDIEFKIVEEAMRDIDLDMYKVKKVGTRKSSSGMDYMMSIFMLTTLFSVLMGYGQLIMRGVIEEKNNRIIEVLISSTDAYRLFYGKIIGIGLAGLTQVALWVILAAIVMGGTSLGLAANISNFMTLELGIYFIIFFVLGYFMYSVLFSIVGASVNTDQEAQQFAAPVAYLLVIPLIIGIMVTQSPDTPLVIAASFFPLFTPTLMFMRISVALPPFSQVLASIFLSLAFIFFLAWLGAKIFRIGILMYGKKPTVRELMRWVRYK